MTDFVLEQLNEQNSRTKPMREVFNSLEKYAKFLKQPLKLEMFVPCDEDGNVLEEPKIEDYFDDGFNLEFNQKHFKDVVLKEYYKAKEKVLFEGFEEMKNAAVRDCVWIKDTETKFHIDTRYGTTVEQLIKSNLKLSQTALNAIFG